MTDQFQLVTKFCPRPQQFAWFLGAGTSAVAGLPTATDVIWDLKRRFYGREENQDLQVSDMQVPAIQERVQAFMESRGFPPIGDPSEYCRYFELIFGDDKERQRQYLMAFLSEKKVTLSVGNRVLAGMMASGFARATFTTNFDSVVERAYAEISGQSISAYHLEGSANANQALNNEEFPLYCKLHGDFRFDSIKNLAADLSFQNVELGKTLTNAANRFGFVIAGYSGRDESVMKLFQQALAGANPFPHGLFWTGRKGSTVLPGVLELIQQAQAKGIEAEYVEVDTFDALMLRLWRNLDNKIPEYDAKVRKTGQASVSIPLPPPGKGEIVRLNALPILELPKTCLAVEFSGQKEWSDLRAASIAAEGALIFTKTDTVLCWGAASTVREHFSDVVSIEEYDLGPRIADLDNNLQVKGFLEEALTRALAQDRPLIARTTKSGSSLVADAHHTNQGAFTALHEQTGKVFGRIVGLMTPIDEQHPEPKEVHYAESVRISADVVAGQAWLVLDPDIWIWPPWAKRQATEFLDKRRANRFNKLYAALLDAWVGIIKGDETNKSEIAITPFGRGSAAENPVFRIGLGETQTRRRAG
ncbi:MAG: SIR2 family protein [Rhizomicrobium sp.]